ncbi:MAG: ABC transporter ATP-binding protein [Actinobacteria bacterium]|jgi:spermidine/putrescine transport system ATP-binding protein|nr:ABC transporter ATP-binding protein [Actinomycetota bacterium]MCO5301416.1 ABC transporter ATP-binding protein [Candidatus Nanopelagicales bacterium]MCB9428916.1 ABC transporter ATP-binding protein [Actinomycetota bacterium]HPE12164.1 ABC transporter ATP-binding protein [Actinomycetota bacterium]HPQ84124.1 ABC transporter ATP-binding protein [Actinomycetota bacterium]
MAKHDITQAEGDLYLENLTKAFGDFKAVNDLSLQVPQGSFFALLGPSGCGKTTTLRMVAGLEDPTAGNIRIGDSDITYTKPYARPVNTVFQNYALFPHMDIYENVAFGLKRRGVKDTQKQVDDALELIQLSSVAKRKPTQLSGGQQQRVALARAIVNRPAVLLLDEPLGALDLKLRRQMQLELKRIQTEVGLTFIHVTHDQEEAMTMADTVAVMNEGVIEQMGPPTDLYESPKTAFVANFLGQSNLFPAKIVELSGEDLILEDIDGRYIMPMSRVSDRVSTTAGTGVLVGVRPEKIAITRFADAGEAPTHGNFVDGHVLSMSFLGVSTQYEVRTRGGDMINVFSQNLDVHNVLPPGTEVRLSWLPHHGFVLSGGEDIHAGMDQAS